MFENLCDANYLLYAAKAYDKPNAVMSEFEEDLNRIVYIKRLLRKYFSTSVLKERLIINHIIVLYNVFGVEAATRLIFFKLEEKDYEVLRPILLFLNYISGDEIVYGIDGKNILTNNIKHDEGTVKCLKQLK